MNSEYLDIIQEIKTKIPAGSIIPKPNNRDNFIVKGWGKRRGEEALIYYIPNHTNPSRPYEKGITVREWQKAYQRLQAGEVFDKDWFTRYLPYCALEGSCNFTTIGGIFQKLGLVDYMRGQYIPRKSN